MEVVPMIVHQRGSDEGQSRLWVSEYNPGYEFM